MTNKTQFTEMELKLMDDITKDCFYENGLDSCIWANVFLDDTCSIDSKKARGVLSSLVKKGIIYEIERGRNGTIKFTDKGIKTMKELGYEE